MGRKPKPGLREAILAEAAAQPRSAPMLRAALERKLDTEPPTLTGVIKAAQGLHESGLLETSTRMPEVYHGARPRTFYQTTPKGLASLKDAVASATAGWTGISAVAANPPAESDAHARAIPNKDTPQAKNERT